jgi:CRP-like cAMP-binding protein
MEYHAILKNIAKHIALEKSEIDFFISLLKKKALKRKEVLLQAGQPCALFNYVESGVLKAYYSDSAGNANVVMFAVHDWWITDMYSFTVEKPSMLTIEALEDSVVFQLTKQAWEQLFLTVPKFERFFRIIMQNAYVREQLRAIQNLSMTAEERYLLFIEKYPQFVNQVPLKQIASYLGMTPEFLSTLRKKISQG